MFTAGHTIFGNRMIFKQHTSFFLNIIWSDMRKTLIFVVRSRRLTKECIAHMKEKLKILIANDDGIRSEGIAKLARAAASFGTVWVAAPEHQCSGMSVRLTISEKSQMAVYRYDFPVPVEAAWSVDGTPADCVKVALNALLPFRPDIVLSGINDGLNAGFDVAYSGTIGAATEAAMHGVPAIAFSMRDGKSFDVTDHYLCSVLGELLEKPLGRGEIWNVNFPTCPLCDCRGILYERFPEKQSYYENYYECVREENGVRYLSPVAKVLHADAVTDGSDIHAVLNGYVSIGKVRCAPF